MVQKTARNEQQRDKEPGGLMLHNDPVPIRVVKGGAVRVGPTRVTLETVIYSFQHGYSPEKIQESFPTLRLADIYSVIGYYLRHKDEVEGYLRQSEIEAEEIRRKIEAYQNSEEFREHQQSRRSAQLT